MKEIWFGFTIVLIFLLLINIASAGLMMGESEVHLKAFEEKEICFGVWTGREGTSHHEVSYSDEIAPFIDSISPIKFDLEAVSCPSDPVQRRACIKELCMNSSIKYCQLVCINFKGPFRVDLFPNETLYEGSIKDVSMLGAATTVVPSSIKVYYTSYDLKIIILIVVIISVILIMFVYFFIQRKKKKH